MSEPRVSIAMCTYNGERFVEQQLSSLAAQTRRPDEIVVCDDCSSDGTVAILEAFATTSGLDVRVIRNETTLGLHANFERAIAACTGEIVFLCDQDDIWLETKIERFLAVFDVHQECGYVFCDAVTFTGDDTVDAESWWSAIGFSGRRQARYSQGDQIDVMLNDGNIVYGMSMAFRSTYRDVVLPIESRSKDYTHDTWIALLLSAIGAVGVALPETLVRYRRHDAQTSIDPSMQPLGPIDRLRFATDYADHLSENNARVLRALAERAARHASPGRGSSEALRALRMKADHIDARRTIRRRRYRMAALTLATTELLSGRYRRFSSGWKSFVKDLIR